MGQFEKALRLAEEDTAGVPEEVPVSEKKAQKKPAASRRGGDTPKGSAFEAVVTAVASVEGFRRTTIALPEYIWEALAKRAIDEKRDRQDLVADALRAYLRV